MADLDARRTHVTTTQSAVIYRDDVCVLAVMCV